MKDDKLIHKRIDASYPVVTNEDLICLHETIHIKVMFSNKNILW